MKIVLIAVNCIAIIGFAVGFQRAFASDSQKFYWIVFLIKWLAAMALGIVYIYYYPSGDTWTYFGEAKKLSALAKVNFSQYLQLLFTSNDTSTVTHFLYVHDRSFLFVKFVSFFNLISGDSYWIAASYFSLVSFFSSWSLFVQLKKFVPDAHRAAALAIFFFPSVLFWSSGLLKETFAVAALYFLTAILVKLLNSAKVSVTQWVLVLLSLWIGWSMKYYWVGIFVCAWFSSLILGILTRKQKIPTVNLFLSWLSLFVVFTLMASFAHPNFRLERIITVIATNHDQFVLQSAPEELIHFYDLHSTWSSMAINSPLAFFSGVLRPLPFETSSPISFLASLENVFMGVMIFSFLLHIRKPIPMFTFPVLIFCATLCIFLALSTPNFGTLSRYRVGFLPFLIFVLSYSNPLLNYLTRQLSFFTK
ncbi:MAG: hypothetical protein ORN54_06850 [Cyclobacteriaceae bacterium]|nr:hypothetical protein [Cyclobacteriaceae bacterium]